MLRQGSQREEKRAFPPFVAACHEVGRMGRVAGTKPMLSLVKGIYAAPTCWELRLAPRPGTARYTLGGMAETKTSRRTVIERGARWLVSGFLMGAADVVPGVSGGTIALVVGIYERLVASIRACSSALGELATGRLTAARAWLQRAEWGLLAGVVLGIVGAVFTLASVIEAQLEANPIPVAALFSGLVIGSVAIAWGMMHRPRGGHLFIAVVTGIALFVALGIRGSISEDAVAQAADPAAVAFLGAGALAICAMILPGISGSLILVIIGMYGPVLSAVADRDLTTVAVFVGGAAIGLALFSQLLNWLLVRHHDVVLAGLVGLMAGSLRVLWPWPDGLQGTALGRPQGSVAIALLWAAVGLVGVTVVARISNRVEAAL